MAKKTVGTLIKEARTEAGMTQAQLAKKVKGVTAADISKCERGEKELDKETLKLMAKALDVTQKSLLEAPSGVKKTEAKTSAAKKKTDTSVKLTAAEKKLLELYRAADSDTKKAAEKLLKGENNNVLGGLLEGAAGLLSGLGKK